MRRWKFSSLSALSSRNMMILRAHACPSVGCRLGQKAIRPPTFVGRFCSFSASRPNQALSFIIRLTNFGTHRYTEDRVWLDVMVDGQARHWYGDSNVFRWHHDWPMSHGSQIQSGLMALEQWLYEQIDQGIPIEPWIARILAESESVAFAGVLLDVGKRAPELFSTVLAPLFFTWEIWDWDFQLATLRQSERQPPGFWGRQAPRLFTLAQEWHQLPHRSEALLTPNGLIARTMLGHQQFRAFFEEVRSAWKAALQQDEGEENLSTCAFSSSGSIPPITPSSSAATKLSRWTSTGRRRSRGRMKRTFANSPRGRRSASYPGAAASSWTLARLFRQTSCSGFGTFSKRLTRSRPTCRATPAGRCSA